MVYILAGVFRVLWKKKGKKEKEEKEKKEKKEKEEKEKKGGCMRACVHVCMYTRYA